jgi:hypothetical protein
MKIAREKLQEKNWIWIKPNTNNIMEGNRSVGQCKVAP